MILSTRAQKIYTEISEEETKLGDLRKFAKEIQKDPFVKKNKTKKQFPLIIGSTSKESIGK